MEITVEKKDCFGYHLFGGYIIENRWQSMMILKEFQPNSAKSSVMKRRKALVYLVF